MEVFKMYEYHDSDTYGIVFDQQIKIGDEKVFEKFKWIKYVSNVEIENNSTKYQGIVFKSFSSEIIENLINIFNMEWSKNKYLLFSDLFIAISNIFKKVRNNEIKKEYLGLMCELAFIKKSQLLGIHNILNFYSKNTFDKFDFHFNHESHIDIKMGNQDKGSFKLNLKQLNSLNGELNKHDISIVFPDYDSINGLNLLELFNDIDGIQGFDSTKEQIENLKFENPSIFDEYKIVIKKSNFIFFNKDLLPKIIVEEKNLLVGATLEIFAHNNAKIDFESTVKRLVNNG